MPRESSVPGSCYFFYPRQVCVVGVRDDARSAVNFASVTWATPLSSDPPLFGVCLSPSTYTHHLVLAAGEFTLSFLTEAHAELAESLGRLSGRETDKVKTLALELAPGETLTTPSLAVAYAAAECVLVERHHVGDQTLVVGEVQGVRLLPDTFDGDGVLRVDRVSPLLYLGHRSYATTSAGVIRPGRSAG